jgi:hypothetical protein
MTRLRLMRACRSHSKNENSGTELSFSDIVNFCTAGGGESARTTLGGSALKLLDAGIYAAAWQNVTGYLAADEMTSLKPNSSGS